MVIKTDNHKKRMDFILEQAVAAVVGGGPDPLEFGIDPDPTSLDIREEEYQEMGSTPAARQGRGGFPYDGKKQNRAE